MREINRILGWNGWRGGFTSDQEFRESFSDEVTWAEISVKNWGTHISDWGNRMFKSLDGKELEFSSNHKVADVTKAEAFKC